MRKIGMAVMVCMAAAAVAHAGGQMDAGCGGGSQLFKNDTKGHQILAATTNGFIGNQTFGISSETSGCTSKAWWAKRLVDQQKFVAANIRDLSREMAQGKGEYLASLSALMGCSNAADFGSFTQAKYESLFPTANTDPSAVLQNLRAELGRDAKLSASCSAL